MPQVSEYVRRNARDPSKTDYVKPHKRGDDDSAESIKLSVNVTQQHIDDGKCGKPTLCMHRCAIEEALQKIDPGPHHHVTVQAGDIRFNLKGHRYAVLAPPRIIKKTLIAVDKELKPRARAERRGEKFVSKVKPHRYVAEFVKGRKVQSPTPERQAQVNEARRKRKAEGRPDRKYYSLRHRIEGMM